MRTIPAAILLLTLAPRGAAAAPGDHLRLGGTILAPQLVTGVEWHSNVYLADGSTDPTLAAAAFVVLPSLEVTRSSDALRLHGKIGWSLRKYLDPDPDDAWNIANADRLTELDGALDAGWKVGKAIELVVDDRFAVEQMPAELPTSAATANYTHTKNDTVGGVTWRPRPNVEIRAALNLGFDGYTVPVELATGRDPNVNDRLALGPDLLGRWTSGARSVWVRANVSRSDWSNNLIYAVGPQYDGGAYGDWIGKPDALIWRVMGGVDGTVGARTQVHAAGGYGRARYDEESVFADAEGLGVPADELATGADESFARDLTSAGEGVLVDLSVRYQSDARRAAVVGYSKGFEDAFYTNYVTYNRAFTDLEVKGSERVTLFTGGSVAVRHLHGEVARDDLEASFDIGARWYAGALFVPEARLGWVSRMCLQADCDDGRFATTQYDDLMLAGRVAMAW